jgi:hypothetical protein
LLPSHGGYNLPIVASTAGYQWPSIRAKLVIANFLIDARVELVVHCQEQVAFGGAVLR